MPLRPRDATAPARVVALVSALFAACGVEGEHEAGAKVEARSGACATCHVDEWSATSSPAHASAGFGQDCGGCHDELAFRPARARGFAHTAAFPLTLAHAEPACVACHAEGFAQRAPSVACVSCHAGVAATVQDPIHTGLSTSCSACHDTDAFAPARFTHAWPLTGAHGRAACRSCHQGSPARYAGTSSACVSCHAADRARADQAVPGHRSNPDACASCHGFESF